MKSVAKRLSAATLMVALLTSVVGVQTAEASTPEAGRSGSIAKVRAPGTEWTFYAAFATAGACWAKAAAYKNEYWWVDATTCVYNAAQNSWFMFYES
ncbi:hypothetical protein OHB41_38615 [Streptomyces sp. NBC_01571]|uniref:hypothetical protein n=1 Tax=Streptomyces sp. NBC_01571 TaxID=2975883 RepID=UPI00224C813D|nr:hypothetical protein [Streptomyces sp. NBC_01571]MCX4579001.1 hypothetical protein [Streptomyces sp. NBC_01571]